MKHKLADCLAEWDSLCKVEAQAAEDIAECSDWGVVAAEMVAVSFLPIVSLVVVVVVYHLGWDLHRHS